MIYALYLNPTIDQTIYLDELNTGGTNRPSKVLTQGGGKALNLATVLVRLGHDVHVMGFSSMINGAPIEAAFRDITTTLTLLPQPARTNIKIYDRRHAVVTEINDAGPTIAEHDLLALEAQLLKMVKSDDLVLMAGSLPKGVPADYYAQLASKLPCPFVADASGDALKAVVRQKPLLIKPNEDELATITGEPTGSHEQILGACAALVQSGIRYCAVSLGKDGALLTDGQSAFFAPPVVATPDSTVGAGDSMLAGLLSVLLTGGDLAKALAIGTAAAAATITLPGTDLATRPLIEDALKRVTVQRLF